MGILYTNQPLARIYRTVDLGVYLLRFSGFRGLDNGTRGYQS